MKNYLLFCLCFIGFIACRKEKTTLPHHDVSSVSGTTTGTTGTPVSLTVTYPYSNGCDFVERFEEERNGNVISIKALAKAVPQNAVCTQEAGFRTIEYKFTASAAGTYPLRFLKTDGSHIVHQITIQ